MFPVEASRIRFTRRQWFAAYSVASLIVFATIANGQQFVNGGFELPNLGPNDYSVSFPTGTGWTFSGAHSGITEGSGGFGLWHVGPPEGDQSAYLRESSTISQTVTGFEIGKQYRVKWAEGLSSNSQMGAMLQLNAINANSQSSTIGASHFVTNTEDWRYRASDVFTADSTSYTFQFLSSVLPYRYGGPTIDDVRITSSPFALLPIEVSTQPHLTSDSTMTIDLYIGDQLLARAVDDNLQGNVDLTLLVDPNGTVEQVRFGADISPVHQQSGSIPVGLLGNLNYQLQDPIIHVGMFPQTSLGTWLDVVNGNILEINSMGLTFDGIFNYQTTGQLPLLVGNGGSVGLDILDTEVSSTQSFSTIPVSPGSFTLTPTGSPHQYQVDAVFDIEYRGYIYADLQISAKLNSHIHARGLVTLAVPETNATVYLAIFGVLCLPFVCRRRGFFGNSTE